MVLPSAHQPMICSVVSGETWGLVWERSTLAAIIAGAPAASLAESGASALPGLRALLGTLPVVRLGDRAVLVVRVSGSVTGPVALTELLGFVVVLSGGWDESGSETSGWWEAGRNGGNEGSENEFHNYIISDPESNELIRQPI